MAGGSVITPKLSTVSHLESIVQRIDNGNRNSVGLSSMSINSIQKPSSNGCMDVNVSESEDVSVFRENPFSQKLWHDMIK